ncbi:MAG: anthranilate phosphoribosyltransferase, partial [Myxococcota bacterium]
GTGGDGASTFNISTVAAIVAAGAGARIVKHGNRAVTSRSGSADVLETLGIRLDVSEDVQRRCVDDAGIAFFFAPNHHQALRHAAAVRRELGVRTFFNLLGPLVNPAGATHQLMGVYDRKYVRACAEVLGHLGVAGAWVVHHESGLDEIGTVGRSFVARLSAGGVEEAVVGPEDFGLEPQPIASLAGGDAKTNAAIATRILEGERRGKDAGPRAAVVLNAAAALLAGGLASEPEAAATLAEDSIDEGRAMARLTRWRELTQ